MKPKKRKRIELGVGYPEYDYGTKGAVGISLGSESHELTEILKIERVDLRKKHRLILEEV